MPGFGVAADTSTVRSDFDSTLDDRRPMLLDARITLDRLVRRHRRVVPPRPCNSVPDERLATSAQPPFLFLLFAFVCSDLGLVVVSTTENVRHFVSLHYYHCRLQ